MDVLSLVPMIPKWALKTMRSVPEDLLDAGLGIELTSSSSASVGELGWDST